jgi:hypothetical protein
LELFPLPVLEGALEEALEWWLNGLFVDRLE